MHWSAGAQVAMGVSERPFVVTREGDRLPGILWMPEHASGPVPLVLIGHGGQSEKRNPNGLALARRFVRRHGFAVAAIDAIDHGERGPIVVSEDPAGHPDYIALWKKPETFDRMVADWSATLDALVVQPGIDGSRVGYWGLSMGTMLGLPFVAAEPRVKAAVLGLCGFAGRSAIRGRFGERHRVDAPRVTVPTLFVVQWDDERFDRDGAFELFGLLGSADKRMHVYPGLHAEVPPEGTDATREFLAAHL
ncbi:dienelactone hydrolase family protein [Candidatus Amarobacter glycogenicus]|uniref:dienelactone hydrolase family protein n=1 Tax=Candidatus Amarobacter glycogenicus TaxID=3140699 RepID=UPI0031369D17|nr:alpha/beta hydrolase [Dehalococcoidia bacterium]